MANIIDYINWRGDLSFQASPFNLVDNLILANLSYIVFKDNVPAYESNEKITLKEAYDKIKPFINTKKITSSDDDTLMFEKLAESNRFGNIQIAYHTDNIDEQVAMQFSATTFILSDNTAYISYRGTDATFVGWKEDFNMSFMTEVPAQKCALEYLKYVASKIDNPLRIGGHSKGGNLAVYAGVYIDEAIQNRILNVYNNDGPGFKESILNSDNYKRIQDKIDTIIPQTSIVGMLLEHEEEYIVVKSDETLIMQHDPFSWEVMGTDFIKLESVTKSSQFIDSTFRKWLADMSEENRAKFVTLVWEVLDATKVKSFTELKENLLSNSIKIVKVINKLSPEDKDTLSQGFSMLFSSAKGSIPSLIDYFKEKDSQNNNN